MRTIAALTMVFLPGTFVSGIFGMVFFDAKEDGYIVDPRWWLFLAITLPLTMATIGTWWLWGPMTKIFHVSGDFFWSKIMRRIIGDTSRDTNV